MCVPDFNIIFLFTFRWSRNCGNSERRGSTKKPYTLVSESLQACYIVRLFNFFLGKYLSYVVQYIPHHHPTSLPPAECRWPESPGHVLGIHHVLRENRACSGCQMPFTIYAYRMFPLERNQIAHAFWKSLVAASQSAWGSSTLMCIFIHCSYIKEFMPARHWHSALSLICFEEGAALLPHIIQINAHQKREWWGYKMDRA